MTRMPGMKRRIDIALKIPCVVAGVRAVKVDQTWPAARPKGDEYYRGE